MNATEKYATCCRRQTHFGRTIGVGLLIAVFVGCGSSEPTPEERLLRRQQERELAELAKPKTREERLDDARGEIELGNHRRAAEITRELLLADPKDVEVIFLAAHAQAASGQKLSAAKTLEAIPEDDPDIGQEALRQAAKWLTDEGSLDQAITRLQRMMQIHGEDTRSLHEVARLLNNAGRRIEAAESLQSLLRAGDVTEKELFSLTTLGNPFIDDSMEKPDFSSAKTPAALAEAKLLQQSNKFSEAKRLCEVLRERFPDSTPIFAFLVKIYSDLQDDKLVDILSNPPEGIEREPEYWHALGVMLQRQGRHENAVRCFGEAVVRDPTDRFSYLSMASSLELLGMTEPASEAERRYEWLDETSRLAYRFGHTRGDHEQLERMADLLDKLRRPFESIGWRMINLKRHGARESEIDALIARREALLSDNPVPSPTWLACGIDLAEMPLPDIADIKSRHNPVADSLNLEKRPLRLTNVTDRSRISFRYQNGTDSHQPQFFLHQLTGGGIGVIDFDLDGWPDCYFTQGGGPPMDASGSAPNQLNRNIDGQSFRDVTTATGTGDLGYGQGVAVADVNQDGFPDLFVANIGPNVLYVNQGDGTFARNVLPSVDDHDQWSTSIACGDLSGDRLPEIVVANYIDDPEVFRVSCHVESDDCAPRDFRPGPDHLLSVGRDGGLVSWSPSPNFQDSPGHGFGIIIANIDARDGNDLLIANDTDRNHYWQSQPERGPDSTRVFVDAAVVSGCATGLRGSRQGSMGIAAGDFDRNGMIDFHVTNFQDQAYDLFLQRAPNLFRNESLSYGVAEPTIPLVGWGSQAVDLDRDGWLDLAVLNGHIFDNSDSGIPYEMRPQLFRGGPNRFDLIESDPADDPFWLTPTLGRTLTTIDWNRDGQLDMLAGHLDVPVVLLENHTESHHWLQLELIGTESERDAIGTEIRLHVGEDRFTSWVVGGDGLLCSNESLVDFGVGQADSIDEVRIKWPTGTSQVFTNVTVNGRYLVVEGSDELFRR